MTTRCPHCFHQLRDDVFAGICVGNCAAVHDAAASAYSGIAVDNRTLVQLVRPSDARRGWSPPALRCDVCGGPTVDVCPDCHYTLPAEWRSGAATCIALAGATATGKSVYIGVLVKQLELLAHLSGSALSAVNDTTRKVYAEFYEKPLYEQRGIMKPTPAAFTEDAPQRHPLIFNLGRINGNPRYIVLRDVAGEDLERGQSDLQHLAFFAHADAVLFMFDPLRVAAIRDTLHGKIPAQLQTGGDPIKVLENVRSIIGRGRPRLAILLSKFDAMQELKYVDNPDWKRVMTNPGAAFSRDPSTNGPAYDANDGDLLHQEVRSLLHRLHASQLVTALENPNSGHRLDFRFFAVSALGASPNGESLAGRGIASFRCLDPLKWVLSAAGAIQATV